MPQAPKIRYFPKSPRKTCTSELDTKCFHEKTKNDDRKHSCELPNNHEIKSSACVQEPKTRIYQIYKTMSPKNTRPKKQTTKRGIEENLGLGQGFALHKLSNLFVQIPMRARSHQIRTHLASISGSCQIRRRPMRRLFLVRKMANGIFLIPEIRLGSCES